MPKATAANAIAQAGLIITIPKVANVALAKRMLRAIPKLIATKESCGNAIQIRFKNHRRFDISVDS